MKPAVSIALHAVNADRAPSAKRTLSKTSESRWQLVALPEATSTNDLARNLAPWHAIRADRQTAGRGRHGRIWSGEEGCLCLSAVVPTTEKAAWEFLPLLAGLATIETLAALGIQGLRLRWPNDILLEDRKLAGILVERPAAERAVIGIGLNVWNDPSASSPELKNLTVSLRDLVTLKWTMDDLAAAILSHISIHHAELVKGGPEPLLVAMQEHWGQPRRVIVHLDDSTLAGLFGGITEQGDLRLVLEDGHQVILQATRVRLLVEE